MIHLNSPWVSFLCFSGYFILLYFYFLISFLFFVPFFSTCLLHLSLLSFFPQAFQLLSSRRSRLRSLPIPPFAFPVRIPDSLLTFPHTPPNSSFPHFLGPYPLHFFLLFPPPPLLPSPLSSPRSLLPAFIAAAFSCCISITLHPVSLPNSLGRPSRSTFHSRHMQY